MRRSLAVLWAILLSAALTQPCSRANAADPTRFDILSLRLYMSVPEVLERLRAQGIADAAVRLGPEGCPMAHAELCAGTISARTRDGQLLLQLAAAPGRGGARIVYRIAYTIVGRGPVDTDALRADAIDRYGSPTSPTTTTWCARLDPLTGTCPADQPLLRIEPAPHAAALVTLSDETIPARKPPGG